MTLFVPYGQGTARGLDATSLGAHGVELDRLVRLGLPVVPGLVVPVADAAQLADPRVAQAAVDLFEQLAGRRVSAPNEGVLVRLMAGTPTGTGPAMDLPGVGVAEATVDELDLICGGRGMVHGVFAGVIRFVGEQLGVASADEFADAEYDAPSAPARVAAFLELFGKDGRPFPSDPAEQLALSAQAMLARWDSPRARRKRRGQGLPEDQGLALYVQAIRLGPPDLSGHGVADSRDPVSGRFEPNGVFRRGVRRVQREDVPAESLDSLPSGRGVLRSALQTLEITFRGAVTAEFEVRDGQLALLAARRVETPGPRVAVRVASDLVASGTLDPATAVASVRVTDLEQLLHPQLRIGGDEIEFVSGLAACPGAAVGRIALSSDRAVEWHEAGESVILVAKETSPGDLPGMLAASAILTTRGGFAAHAAVVARGLGRPAVCGAAALHIDAVNRTVTAAGRTLAEGETVSIDGSSGKVYIGAVRLVPPQPSDDLEDLLRHADGLRRLGVRANADNGRDAAIAIENGAEGVGLCRTEHQFLGDRLPLVRRFLVADDPDEEAAALVELGAAQKQDFLELLSVTRDRPVTIRLLDAPLHEFLGHDAHEVNPMLGLRGVRLAVTRAGLYPAQARALFAAWVELAAEGVRPQLEVMVPLVAISGEFEIGVAGIREAADDIESSTGVRVPYRVGTMIETPRAALIAGELARTAQFLSFGTNDLTQLTYGFSRDDVESSLLSVYVDRGLIPASPFARLDPQGVGALIRGATAAARAQNPEIKIGICGEHGGDPASIELCEQYGLDYVSCAPSRVPGARLAAAHAASGVSASTR